MALDNAVQDARDNRFVPPDVAHERIRTMYTWENVARRAEKVSCAETRAVPSWNWLLLSNRETLMNICRATSLAWNFSVESLTVSLVRVKEDVCLTSNKTTENEFDSRNFLILDI